MPGMAVVWFAWWSLAFVAAIPVIQVFAFYLLAFAAKRLLVVTTVRTFSLLGCFATYQNSAGLDWVGKHPSYLEALCKYYTKTDERHHNLKITTQPTKKKKKMVSNNKYMRTNQRHSPPHENSEKNGLKLEERFRPLLAIFSCVWVWPWVGETSSVSW